uniref:GRIP domain-containing protein n=1 Tax=Elaeophora elaphi TaxID=1147741 RepID=A0A0R3RXN0_9BILA
MELVDCKFNILYDKIMSVSNVASPDDELRNGTVSSTSASISEEEFCRLQEQLLELRNRNYELLEENRRQQSYINSLSSKGAEALLFASKLVGRKKDKDNSNEKLENEVRLLQHKLSSQEEEFRLQQSTLLSELNKIKASNQELLLSKKMLIEEINMERVRSANMLGELQGTKEQYTTVKQLLKEKEAIIALHEGLKERVITSDEQSQTDDLQEYIRSLEMECERLREIEKVTSEKDALLKKEQEMQNILEMELQTVKAVILAEKEKKIAEEAVWEETKQGLDTEIEALNMHVLELQRSKEEECASAAQNFEVIKVALEAKIKESEEEIKRKDEEMKVALKKQSSMVKELRRQVQSEKKRAEQAEKHLDDVLGMGDATVYAHSNARIRVSGSPSTLSDRFKVKGDGESSICSWAFVAEPDRNSFHNFDEESSCSASILEADNAELISRLAVLQKKHAETIDRLNVIEEENTLLRKEVDEKSEVIAQWIRTIPDLNHGPQVANSSPGLRFRRMLEMVRMDESAADIRDMNRRLQRMLEETLSKNLVLQKLDSEFELASTVPGGTNIPEANERLDVDLDKTAAGLRTADDGTFEENRCDDESLLDELSRREFTVFVLSEVGKPIFASCGHEEQLCSLIALIQTFVMVVTSWNDSLKRIRSAHMQISFSYRSPLILCIVSRDGFQLDAQVDLVYKQMLSIICRAQLVSIFETKGPNFDLRFMLQGMNDIAVFMRSIRIFPMAFADREQFTNAIVSAVNDAKVENVVYGLVLANRQLITIVRMKGITLNPCDLHLLINLIDCNPSLKNADNWIPICLPQFNDTGFLYAYVSFIWEGSSACLLLLSLERGAFETLRGVKETIITKLRSSKLRVSLKNAVDNPSSFDIQADVPSDLWHFTYKNRCSSQICCSQHLLPFIEKNERWKLQEYYKKMFAYSMRTPTLRHIFITRPECCLLSNVTSNYELHCVLSPFVTRASASAHVDRLLKMLKKEEAKFFTTSSVYF